MLKIRNLLVNAVYIAAEVEKIEVMWYIMFINIYLQKGGKL